MEKVSSSKNYLSKFLDFRVPTRNMSVSFESLPKQKISIQPQPR